MSAHEGLDRVFAVLQSYDDLNKGNDAACWVVDTLALRNQKRRSAIKLLNSNSSPSSSNDEASNNSDEEASDSSDGPDDNYREAAPRSPPQATPLTPAPRPAPLLRRTEGQSRQDRSPENLPPRGARSSSILNSEPRALEFASLMRRLTGGATEDNRARMTRSQARNAAPIDHLSRPGAPSESSGPPLTLVLPVPPWEGSRL